MVIITDANGNIQAPTIPENVYQGSNLANEIVFLAPLPQTNVATITFRLPNGILIEEQTMTPYNDVPGNYSGWKYVLNDVITQYYGQVTFQIHLYGGTSASEVWIIKDEPSISAGYFTGLNFKSAGQTFNSWTLVVGTPNAINYGGETAYRSNTGWVDIRYKRVEFLSGLEENQNLKNWLLANAEKQQPTLVTTVAGTFPVLRGVPRLPHSTPSQESWNEILNWVAEANEKIANYEAGILESKAILQYDSTFPYSLGANVYDNTTKSFYTCIKVDENDDNKNVGHSLNLTEWWGQTRIYSQAEIENFIDAKITTHNESGTAHSDIRADILANTGRIGDIEDLIPSGTTQANPLVNESQMTTITDALDGRVEDIEELIPEQASPSNQLADKNFVNSSIATNTANFKGTYNIVTDLGLTTSATEQQIATALASEISSADDNDYCFVAYPDATDPTQFTKYDRYKYNGSAWVYEYTLNNSSFTAQQWEAINSGITAGLVSKIGSATLTTTAQDLSGAVNEINAKVQIATRNTAGTVYAWEDANGFHIWLSDPNQVNVQTAQNIQGGETYTIRTMDYTETENLSGGLTIEIGEGE